MRVTEPMTMITDYVMGALALVLAARLLNVGVAFHRTSVTLFALTFLMTAVAALVGGSYHGFVQMVPIPAARVMWKVTLVATGIGSASLLAGAIYAGTIGTWQRLLLAVVLVKLATYLWWISSHDDFVFVIADYGSALVGLLVLSSVMRPSGLTPAAAWFAAGVAVSAVAGLIQYFKLAPHPRFNHNDLFHVVQMLALYLLFRGGALLRDMG